MNEPYHFSEEQIRDVLFCYGMQAAMPYRDGIWLYGIPAAFKRPTNEDDEQLADDLVSQLIAEGYLTLTEQTGVFIRSDLATEFLKRNRIML